MKRTPQASKARPKKRTTTRKSPVSDVTGRLQRKPSSVGSITLLISEEDIGAWKPGGPRKRGGQFQYSDGAIHDGAQRLPLDPRPAEGFLRSMFQCWSGSCRCRCKRAKRLAVSLLRKAWARAPGTGQSGLKVFGEGEWKVRNMAIPNRTWRKRHLSGSVKPRRSRPWYSEANDAGAVRTSGPEHRVVEQVGGDGAYDKRKVYEGCAPRGIGSNFLKGCPYWQHGNCAAPPLVRDENLRRIRKVGHKRCKFP